MFQILLLSLLTSIQVVLSIPLILLHIFNIQGFRISDKCEINNIINKLKIKGSTLVSNDKPEGFIYGKWYLGFISVSNGQNNKTTKTMYIIMKNNKYNEIKDKTNEENNKKIDILYKDENETKNIKVWYRRGNYFWLEYHSRLLNVEEYKPYEYQNNIIKNILTNFNKIKIVMLYGEPGSGKSMIPILTAKKCGGHYCNKWNPTEPGDTISSLYGEILPSNDKPLILVLEEFDSIIDKLGKISPHKHIPIEVKNKTGWNCLLDELQMKVYPNLILFLISNKSPEYINSIDSSYIRKGRVDDIYFVEKGSFNKI